MIENHDQVAVFGGAGNMGRLTVELFQNLGYRTLAVDPKDPNSLSPAEAISSSRIIFFSVDPIEKIEEIILGNEALFNKDHLVLDNATRKRPLKDAYQRLLQQGISICSTHPLYKHDQPPYGQKTLIMPVGENSAEAVIVGDSLYRNVGNEIIIFDINQHDTHLLAVQVPHILNRAMARAFEKMGVDMRYLQSIAPANYQLYDLSLWRTLVQESKTSAGIVANFSGTEEGQDIINKMRNSFEEVVSGKSRDDLTNFFEATYLELGGKKLGPVMNEKTKTVLERLANLAKRSFTFFTTDDNLGSLVEKLRPMAEKGISLNAVDSSHMGGQIKFEIGIYPETSREALEEVFASLRSLGCTVQEEQSY